jgi:PIN domain nuclease of toxin-antitoxin system
VILLDTHALIWWVDGTGERLSTRARKRVEQELARVQRGEAQAGLLVSAISCWEVAMLVNRGRLALSLELERWLALVAAIPAVRLLPLEPAVAVAATRLPDPFHADPADRFLVAQARAMAVPLLSADSRIQAYPHVQWLW